jgi:uncharacterized protein
MRIEVVYALPEAQERVLLDLPPESTVLDAIRSSGLIERRPEISLGRVGIWGRPVTPKTRLRDRDRVEIYRPLIADSKEARRRRAAKKRK